MHTPASDALSILAREKDRLRQYLKRHPEEQVKITFALSLLTTERQRIRAGADWKAERAEAARQSHRGRASAVRDEAQAMLRGVPLVIPVPAISAPLPPAPVPIPVPLPGPARPPHSVTVDEDTGAVLADNWDGLPGYVRNVTQTA
jgi:hypothetical protein